jgi:hypothetical protein
MVRFYSRRAVVFHFLAFLSAGLFGGSAESEKVDKLCVLRVSSEARGEIIYYLNGEKNANER